MSVSQLDVFKQKVITYIALYEHESLPSRKEAWSILQEVTTMFNNLESSQRFKARDILIEHGLTK